MLRTNSDTDSETDKQKDSQEVEEKEGIASSDLSDKARIYKVDTLSTEKPIISLSIICLKIFKSYM